MYIYEEIFQLVEYCGIRYNEAWDMPVVVRKWWIERKNKEEQEKKKGKGRDQQQPAAPLSKAPWETSKR